MLPGRRRRGGGRRGAPAGHLHAERRAEALHDRVDARADDERGGPVVRRLLQVDDHEPLGQRRHVRRRDDAQRRAQGQADVRGAERALRGAPLGRRQAVVPIQYRVPHGAAARAARVPRRLERHAAQVHVVERLRAARLALLREDAAVQHAELVPREARPAVQPVDVLRREEVEGPGPLERDERVVRERRPHGLEGGARDGREVRRPRLLPLLLLLGLVLERPDALRPAEVGQPRARRHAGARQDDDALRGAHHVDESRELGLEHGRRVLGLGEPRHALVLVVAEPRRVAAAGVRRRLGLALRARFRRRRRRASRAAGRAGAPSEVGVDEGAGGAGPADGRDFSHMT